MMSLSGNDKSGDRDTRKKAKLSSEEENNQTRVSEKEKDQKTSSKGKKQQIMLSDDEEEYQWRSCGTRPMTRKESARYHQQLADSDVTTALHFSFKTRLVVPGLLENKFGDRDMRKKAKLSSEQENNQTTVSEEEKDQKTSSKGEKQQIMLSDDEEEYQWRSCGTRPMTRKESARYHQQLADSDGFELDYMPLVAEIGIRKRALLRRDAPLVDELARTAIDTFNHSGFQIEEGILEFVKVEMAVLAAVSGILYYITFTAKNLKHGKNIIYQSVVWRKIAGPYEVQCFRRKPSGSGADDKNNYFWNDIYRNCCPINSYT